jgi:broad specificity phosphatase PhoE
MDEARKVLERLRRIELLEAEGARPEQVLAEVRALLAEAEGWVRAERPGSERAEEALERARAALTEGRVPVAAR